MATKKSNIDKLEGKAKAHFERVFPHANEALHGKNFKYITRRTHAKSGAVDYILFNYGAVKTKEGIKDAYEPLGTNFEYERVADLAKEKEWFATYCLNKFGAPTPNA